MSFIAVAVGGSAALGALGGALKSGPDLNTSGLGNMTSAYNAYSNLVGQGANGSDVANATTAQRNLAQTYQNDSNNPMSMYNFAAGNQIASQQFGAQRQQLAQTMQSQISQAQQSAASAGRSVYDPVLQSRLAGQAMTMNAGLNAQQQSAAVGYAGQIGQQQLQNQVNSTNTLTGLANTAFSGQQNLFQMGQGIQGSNNQIAQYQQSQGGGLKGALTGLAGGMGAGASMAGGISQMQSAGAMSNYYNSMSSMGGMGGMSTGGSSGFGGLGAMGSMIA